MKTTFFLLLLCAAAALPAGLIGQKQPPGLSAADIPGCRITRQEEFGGSALWGYIDGGADIYLEYGFDRLFLQEISWRKYNFKLEIFSMKGPEPAFGIYSVSQRRCLSDSLSRFSCITPHQIQMAVGVNYISIVNDSGSGEEQRLGLVLARKLLPKLRQESFQIPPIFSSRTYLPFLKDLRFISGKLGLQNGFPEWEDVFEGTGIFSAYILPVESGNSKIVTATIRFAQEAGKVQFLKRLGLDTSVTRTVSNRTAHGIYRAARELPPGQIIFLESDAGKESLVPFLDEIESIK